MGAVGLVGCNNLDDQADTRIDQLMGDEQLTRRDPGVESRERPQGQNGLSPQQNYGKS